jgi:hypothetical protein
MCNYTIVWAADLISFLHCYEKVFGQTEWQSCSPLPFCRKLGNAKIVTNSVLHKRVLQLSFLCNTLPYLNLISKRMNFRQSCSFKLEQGEGGSEEQCSVAVCGGIPVLQIGVTGRIC